MTQHNVRVSARTARITASDAEGGHTFGGIAVGIDDILYTDDGTPVIFTEEVLAEYAETQAGEPLSIDHPEDENGNPLYPPPVEETAGKVPKAGFVPNKGLGYEANTHDETVADGVQAGSYEVSVHPTFDLTDEQDPETGAYIPTNVSFNDLSVVSKGMSPSNTAEWGANAALASWTRQADIGAELEASNDSKQVEVGSLAWFRKMARKAGLTAAAPSEGDAVRWQSSDGGEREPDDYRYGVVVDGLQDGPDDKVKVAVYQSNSDGDGWENRNEQNDMKTDNLEVVGSDGKESLPPVSQVTASAQSPDEEAEPSTDAEADDIEDQPMEDETTEETEEQTEEVEADTEAETESESNVVEVNIGDHDSFDAFIEAKISETQEQTDKSEKVTEIIEASDEFDEDDRDELMASSEKLIERQHKRVTGEVTASLPGSAGARRQIQAGGGDEDLVEKFGTGMQE